MVIADQTGSTSIVKSLAVAKSDTNYTLPVDAVGIQTALSAPDSSFSQVEFQKGSGESAFGHGSVAVNTALTAPKKPVVVNAIDKTQVVRNNYAE